MSTYKNTEHGRSLLVPELTRWRSLFGELGTNRDKSCQRRWAGFPKRTPKLSLACVSMCAHNVHTHERKMVLVEDLVFSLAFV